MKELQKQFSGIGQVRGYDFNLITARLYGYIYTKSSLEGINTFEVFKRLENDVYNCISYPTDKAFGIWAWNTSTLDNAFEKLNRLKPDKKNTPLLHI
jgi:nicotinamide riboside transporter PnuC